MRPRHHLLFRILEGNLIENRIYIKEMSMPSFFYISKYLLANFKDNSTLKISHNYKDQVGRKELLTIVQSTKATISELGNGQQIK